MQTTSHNVPQKMPEKFSGSPDFHPENSQEIAAHTLEHATTLYNPELADNAEYITHLTKTPRQAVSIEPTVAIAHSSRDYAQVIKAAGAHIITARHREMRTDNDRPSLRISRHNQRERLSIAEMLLGKQAARAMQRSVKTLVALGPEARFHHLEAEYMRREAVAGQRVMGQKNMQFFCQDAHTWVWHIDGETPKTMLYHIRPEGVIKERIGGTISQVTGKELEYFGQYVQAYYQEVNDTVYRQTPDTTQQPAGNSWALAA